MRRRGDEVDEGGPCLVCGAYDGEHDAGCLAAPAWSRRAVLRLVGGLLVGACVAAAVVERLRGRAGR